MTAPIVILGSFSIRPTDIAVSWREEDLRTRLGSMPVLTAEVDGARVVYLTRSGGRRGVAPHLVAYRAVILALQELDVRRVVATYVVGSLSRGIPVGSLVVLDQFLDFTRTRITTLFGSDCFANVDVTDPYCPALRGALITAGRGDQRLRPHGCYVGVDGPRYETRAEVEMYRRLGGDVIGMTGLPEAVLAREAGICFASVAIVSNLGAGLASGPVSREEHARVVAGLGAAVGPLLRRAVAASVELDESCDCRTAAADLVRADDATAGERVTTPEELSLVLLRPSVLDDRRVGDVLAALESVAVIRAVKSVLLPAEVIDAVFDRPGIASPLSGIRDAYGGLPGVAVALAGPPGTCRVVESEVDSLRRRFAADAPHNGVHASGDAEVARRELALFFAPEELALHQSGDDRSARNTIERAEEA